MVLSSALPAVVRVTHGQYLLETLVAQATGSLEAARLHQELRRKERARAALVGRLIGAQEEEERRRIARELHDFEVAALAAAWVW